MERLHWNSPPPESVAFSKEELVGFIYMKPVPVVHNSAKRPCPERRVPGAGVAGAQSKALGSLHTSRLLQAPLLPEGDSLF